ncbi:MAG TPA: hypothetical protein VJB90_05235 [Candidatus Nanoarchaeia archaeon]|nr:hypothetical protein [Candidatus Nanoarchaeia archaeon]
MTANNIQFTKIEIQIAKYLFKHYKDRHNARQLAKILDLNHAHVNKLCNLLTDKKLLVKERIGNSVYFNYDYNNGIAIKFMEYILSLEEKEFPEWLIVLLHSLNRFKPYIQLGLVFGSAIKTRDFHDIDILIMYEKDKSAIIKKIKDEIRKSELVENPVRYVDITEKDISLNKEDKIFYNMLSDNLVFHNPEKHIEVIRKCRK